MIKHTRSMTNSPPGTNGFVFFFESILVQYMDKTCKTWCSILHELSGSTGGKVHYYCISFLELFKSLIQLSCEQSSLPNHIAWYLFGSTGFPRGNPSLSFCNRDAGFHDISQETTGMKRMNPVTCYILVSYVAQQSRKIRFPLASMVLKGSLKDVSSPPEQKCIITKNFRYLKWRYKIPNLIF